MKNITILALLLFATTALKAQIQFPFSNCFNNWGSFVDAGNGIKVRAAYWKNSMGDQWWAQIMNTNDNPVTVTYSIYGGNGHLTQTISLGAQAVSGYIDANRGMGLLYGTDIFITIKKD